ncbi:MAG TPA: VOC family protein [Chloroflexota bacterium]|nr:VOC family protein [Chloroflexota bacterium]
MAQTTLTTLKANSIDHVVLHVRDVDRAKRFYVEFLGMTVAHEHGRQTFLRCGSQLVALFEPSEGADIHAGSELNHMALKLESGDFEQVSAALKAAGIRFWGREGDPYCIYLEDPDGHRLQLITTDHGQRPHEHS